jgi:ribonucleoside-diphosphate reductase alpha chain
MPSEKPADSNANESTALDNPNDNFATLEHYHVIRRNGQLNCFDPRKIISAMTQAFLAVEGNSAAASNRIQNAINGLTQQVIRGISRHLSEEGTVHIEDIQDQVELALMRAGFHKVARAYVLYREEHAHLRAEKKEKALIHITDEAGRRCPLDEDRLGALITEACANLDEVKPKLILEESLKNLFDGISKRDVNHVLVMTTRTLIEKEPNYTYVAARLLLNQLRSEAFNFLQLNTVFATASNITHYYSDYFKAYIYNAIDKELLEPKLAEFDLTRLGKAIKAERDLQFTYLGLQTLYDRYFLHWENIRFELPQAFFMRVSMGLALNEADREARAIEFYEALSQFDFMTSTPTLFNSGTLRPQLSSCYLTTVPDDLEGIYDAIKDNALLSKYAGGLGNDWTPVRGMGSHIKGTNGKSQGVVPFLKVANDTLVAVNQSLSAGTRVISADGVKPVEEVKVGEDLLLTGQGVFSPVKAVHAYQCGEGLVEGKPKRVIEINTERQLIPLRVTDEHPIFVLRGVNRSNGFKRQNLEDKPKQWVNAGEITETDMIGHVIPTDSSNPLNLSPDDARFYGIMLGDGHIQKRKWGYAGVSLGLSKKPETISFVKAYLTAQKVHYWQTIDGNCLYISWSASKLSWLNRENLYDSNGAKSIHRDMLHLPKPLVVPLLIGLIETDGYLKGGERISFTSSSLNLIEAIRYIVKKCHVLASGHVKKLDGATFTNRKGEQVKVDKPFTTYELSIPACEELANHFGISPYKQAYWVYHNQMLFERVNSVKVIEDYQDTVYDFVIEGDPSYTATAALVHNGGRRRGSGCAYLETWHIDIEEFLELRKNTGDERRRTHDMNTASWIPDEMMKRVYENREWTLFSPDEVPDLHELYGEAFTAAYEQYEAAAEDGKIQRWKRVSAVELWRKILTMLFETAHPWLCFKDPCNLRSPQQHVGVVHSSNLCTEITLNTKAGEEIGVCNLASINLPAHIQDGKLNIEKLQMTIQTAIRALDNVIDINYYSVPEARNANMRHRPIGLGIMGFQDTLYKLRLPYGSQEAVDFADYAQEIISYYAISASTDLAEERGAYASFTGSLWHQGILPIDSIQYLAKAREHYFELSTTSTLDWDKLRERVKTVGMRNSNTMAIAPTATISNISGVTQSIEPTYQNLYVKSNLSGEFTIINPYLVRDLKALELWDDVMVNDLKYYDGSIQSIDRIPTEIKDLYATAFEIEPTWLVEAAARRQKWIDQSQSLNLYMLEPSGRKLDNLYKLAWLRGLKTTYYLRTMGATRVQKSTAMNTQINAISAPSCSLDNNEECEVCQ